MTWFQDGTKLLVSGPAGPRDGSGIWVLPAAGGALSKLEEDARGAVASPEGSRIVFRRNSLPEIWLVNTSGEGRRRLVVAQPGYGFSEKLAWSPDGQRVAFETADRIGSEVTLQTYDLGTGRTTMLLSDPQLEDFCWLRDGRLLYSRREAVPNRRSSNLWEIGVDPHTARPRGKPRRLTDWSDFNLSSLAASADGRRLSFVRVRADSNVYVAELTGNAGLTKPRPLTFDEWVDWPTGWTRDSRAVLFHSDRNGTLNIFRQSLSAVEPQALVPGEEARTDPRLSPDGRWILYLAWRTDPKGNPTGEGQLMRVALSAGTAELVFPVVGYAGEAAGEQIFSSYKRPVPAAEGNPRFRCPSVPQSPCVLSEKLQNQIVFTAFDPLQGRMGELTRIEVAESRRAFWDLSRDGRWIAFGITDDTNGRIRLLSLTDRKGREISAGNWANLTSVAWAADGKALFVTGFASKKPPLLRLSLTGEARLLFTGRYYIENPVPSPDGRYLAFGDVSEDDNAWVLEYPPDR